MQDKARIVAEPIVKKITPWFDELTKEIREIKATGAAKHIAMTMVLNAIEREAHERAKKHRTIADDETKKLS